jgi:ribonuclease HI
MARDPPRRPDRLKLFFDGGCRPNPGPMEVAIVTQGQVRFHDDLGHGTHNDAEWLALIHALMLAQSLGVEACELVGDAAMVVDQANGAGLSQGVDASPRPVQGSGRIGAKGAGALDRTVEKSGRDRADPPPRRSAVRSRARPGGETGRADVP